MVQADVRSVLPSAGHTPSNFISCLAVATETTMTGCWISLGIGASDHIQKSSEILRNPQKSSEHLVRFLGDRDGPGTPFRSERSFAVLPSIAGKSHFQVIEVSLSLGIVMLQESRHCMFQVAECFRMLPVPEWSDCNQLWFLDVFGTSWSSLIFPIWPTLAMPWAQPSETPTSPFFQAAGGSKCCGCSWFIRSEVRVGSWSCDQTHTPSPGYLLGYRRLMMANVYHELLNMAEPCLGSETPTVCICMSLTSKPVGRESQVLTPLPLPSELNPRWLELLPWLAWPLLLACGMWKSKSKCPTIWVPI